MKHELKAPVDQYAEAGVHGAVRGEEKHYSGYKELKERRMDLHRAKDNVQRFLGIDRDAPERVEPRE